MSYTPGADGLGYMHVNFPKLEQGATDMQAAHNMMVNELEDLETYLRTQLPWQGTAKDEFEAAMARCERRSNDAAAALSGFGGYLNGASERTRNTEAINSSIWT